MRWAADSILSDSVDVDTGDVGGGDATRPSLQNRFHLFLSQGQSSAASALVSESEKETPEDSERGKEKTSFSTIDRGRRSFANKSNGPNLRGPKTALEV